MVYICYLGYLGVFCQLETPAPNYLGRPRVGTRLAVVSMSSKILVSSPSPVLVSAAFASAATSPKRKAAGLHEPAGRQAWLSVGARMVKLNGTPTLV